MIGGKATPSHVFIATINSKTHNQDFQTFTWFKIVEISNMYATGYDRTLPLPTGLEARAVSYSSYH